MDRDIWKVKCNENQNTYMPVKRPLPDRSVRWYKKRENQYPNTLEYNLHNSELTNIQIKSFKKDDHSKEATSRGNDENKLN